MALFFSFAPHGSCLFANTHKFKSSEITKTPCSPFLKVYSETRIITINRLANNEKNRIELSKCDICLRDIMTDVHRKNQRNRWKVEICLIRSNADSLLNAQIFRVTTKRYFSCLKVKVKVSCLKVKGQNYFSRSNIDWVINFQTFLSDRSVDDGSDNTANEQRTKTIAPQVHFKFWYISLPSPQNNNVKWPNSRFCGEHEQTTVIFSFSLRFNLNATPTNLGNLLAA